MVNIMNRKKERGFVLVTLIIAITLMAAFGAATYSITTTSTFGQTVENNNQNAYQLARAGIRYAVSTGTTNIASTNFYMSETSKMFNLVAAGGIITSTGIVNQGAFNESRRIIIANASGVSLSGPTITFDKDMPSIGSPIVNKPQAIVIDPDSKQINMGGGVNDGYGSVWYQGSSNACSCDNGVCLFGIGLRVYFEFKFFTEDYSANSTNSADGFTFAIISALNGRARSGGAPAGTSIGEMVGYAGPDATADKLGLLPPKMAMEFDTYPNSNGDVCGSGSRNDNPVGNSFRNHMALMFWGHRTIAGNCSSGGVSYPKGSYDDNRHGAGGSGNDPVNSLVGGAGYYQGAKSTCHSSANTCNWMEDGKLHRFRMEIVRPLTPNAITSKYDYNIKAWIDCTGSCNLANFKNVVDAYTNTAPQINRTVSFSAADHDNLGKMYWGFTQATGGATQQVTLSGLDLSCPVQCYNMPSINPTAASVAAGGTTTTVAVTADAVCKWTATSNEPWITVNSPTQTTNGNGTVSYTVYANSGGARTGTITIGGQTFVISQAGGFSCTGGVETSVGGRTIRTFNSNGTLRCNMATNAEVLVVGGGGAGGGRHGGGGGAGGVVYNPSVAIAAATDYLVTVGAGGEPTQTAWNNQSVGGNGQNSVFGTLTALGGGGGGSYTAAVPVGGGSGGGGGGGNNTAAGLANQPTSASGGFGNAGGNGAPSGGTGGGGGGGAGAVGQPAAGANNGGAGGTGMTMTVGGVNYAVAGGGGGGGENGGGTGGLGGGGNGGIGNLIDNGTEGAPNTGGGGGGVRSTWGFTYVQGRDGGSGVVIISY